MAIVSRRFGQNGVGVVARSRDLGGKRPEEAFIEGVAAGVVPAGLGPGNAQNRLGVIVHALELLPPLEWVGSKTRNDLALQRVVTHHQVFVPGDELVVCSP